MTAFFSGSFSLPHSFLLSKPIPRWDVHFGGLEDDRKGSTEPHITFRPQLGRHRRYGLAICRFHLGFSLVLDSTGLKVFGEGEWKVRQHGYAKRRTWRKLHLSVDSETQEIQAVVLSEASLDDAGATPDLLNQSAGSVEQVGGDGAYDKRKVYEGCAVRGIRRVAIPPRKDARIWQHGNCAAPPLVRDENLRRIRKVGRKRWKQESGYHRRSLAETAMFRVKTIFGSYLQARKLPQQKVEAEVKCAALNRMTHLEMPDNYGLTSTVTGPRPLIRGAGPKVGHRTWASVGSPVAPPGALQHATPAADTVVRSIPRQHPRTPGRSEAWYR